MPLTKCGTRDLLEKFCAKGIKGDLLVCDYLDDKSLHVVKMKHSKDLAMGALCWDMFSGAVEI